MAVFADQHYLDVLSRLFLALVLGGLIGLEREFHGRAAGLRTHILVCLGSALLVVSAAEIEFAYAGLAAGGTIRLDPTRLAAGIVTGIGFLGAGAILRSGDTIHGLTTASCIWLVAAIGVTAGGGFHALAATATAIALLALVGLHHLEKLVPADHYHTLRVEADSDEAHSKVSEILHREKAHVQRYEIRSEPGNADRTPKIEIAYHLKHKNDIGRSTVAAVSGVAGVRSARWEFER